MSELEGPRYHLRGSNFWEEDTDERTPIVQISRPQSRGWVLFQGKSEILEGFQNCEMMWNGFIFNNHVGCCGELTAGSKGLAGKPGRCQGGPRLGC